MPRPITNYSEAAALRRRNAKARYDILKGFGVKGKAASLSCNSIGSFSKALIKLGKDPKDYPELIINRTKVHTNPKNKLKSTRYHALRDLGASSAEATYYSASETLFEEASSILKRGIRL